MSVERTQNRTAKCPVCSSGDVVIFAEIEQVPVNCNILCTTRQEATGMPKADMQLAFCWDCGHVFNQAFDSALVKYTHQYENEHTLRYASRFQDYAHTLATDLVRRYDLQNKDIIEIGCGRGEFLMLLCEMGNNRGVGFDPAYRPNRLARSSALKVRFIADVFSDRYSSYKADFICCRRVLELIHAPRTFLSDLRRTIGNQRAVVYFEVPNALRMLRELSVWDFIYENRSYYSSGSLTYAFRASGFEVRRNTEQLSDTFVAIEAVPTPTISVPKSAYSDGFQQMARNVSAFAQRYRDKVSTWMRNLEELKRNGQRAVVWGAGIKGVMFLNTLDPQRQIEYVVDINPRKQGMYIVGTGHQIVAPELLREYRPDVVILMNQDYEEEVQQLLDHVGVEARFAYA